MSALRGRRILVTGGGSGIGRAVSIAYAEAGAVVTVLERSAEFADSLEREAHGRIQAVVGDATDAGAVQEALSVAAPDARLDNLTLCVGVFDNRQSLRALDADQLARASEEIWRVNVRSALEAVRCAIPHLQATAEVGRPSSITLTLSESALYPVGGGVLYGSSKWALRGMVGHLAADLAPLIRVNAVAPGGTTNTRLAGLSSLHQTQTADRVPGRDERIAAGALLEVTARPEDHAGAYCYLADPVAARIVTGVVIPTDGGRRY